MSEKFSNTLKISENKSEKKIFSKKNFIELKKFFEQLIKNFWEIKDEDKKILNENKKNNSEEFLISNFRKILNRRANNWEMWIIFLFEEIKKNKKLWEIFEEDFLFAKKILDTNSKIFNTIKIS